MINLDKYICKAKDTNTGGWVYGYYVCVPNRYRHDMAHLIIAQECEYHGCGEFWYMDVHEVDPGTVCRYTGIEDKYGNPIFEHDILYGIFYFIGPEETTFEVCWQDEFT